MYLLRWQKLNLKSTKLWRLFLGESFWILMHYFQRTVNITSNLNSNALFSDNSQITSNLFGITRQYIRGYRDILQNLKFSDDYCSSCPGTARTLINYIASIRVQKAGQIGKTNWVEVLTNKHWTGFVGSKGIFSVKT